MLDGRSIDLVLCRHEGSSRTYLFEAPSYSTLTEGDEVVVDTKSGQKPAEVIASCTCSVGNEYYKMIIAATGATLPLRRVLRQVFYREIIYLED